MLYLHEIIDIVGTGQESYLATVAERARHSTGEGMSRLAGTWKVIGSTNRITNPAPVGLAQYDAGGNLTSWSDATTTATYTWDLFNRMSRWGNGSEGWSYVYTADDERLWSIKDVANAAYSNWTIRGLGLTPPLLRLMIPRVTENDCWIVVQKSSSAATSMGEI